MRAVAAVLWLLAQAAPARASDDDDPKRARPAPVETFVLPDEDDPKLARGAPPRRPWWRVEHPVPRFKLAYRRLWAPAIDGGTQPFDAGELDFYPVSGLLRFGVIGEVGWGGGKYGLWYLSAGASLGVQYPARVTPFFEGRFVAGLIGGQFEGNPVVSWIYAGGLDGGIEVYYFRRLYVSAAIGWTHPVYGAVDAAALMANPHSTPILKTLSSDSFTFKLGLGF
jgi:hypothetical protein